MRAKSAFICLITFISLSPLTQASDIIKSPNDQRQYATFTLENQLQVLIISDPTTDKAAASLDIDVGSASNPASRPGLAHFLEHMLFLGTEKYPSANDYSSFIDSHGGSHNAFTSQNNTNYYFDIKQDALEGGLERFSQFFIAPLLTEKYTERERKAVHSEYQARLRDDNQRNYSAFKQLMNPLHPGKRFFVGSLDSLSDTATSSIRDDLKSFYNSYYSANRMTLVVLGKESLSALKPLVIEKFSAIPNRQVVKPEITVTKFVENQLPLQLNVKSLKDIRRLTLSFPTKAAKKLYQNKPLSYLSSIVGYEGEGSLIAYLKELGYVNGLSAGVSHDSNIESTFQVTLSLTQQGLENTDAVIESLFSFIQKVKTNASHEVLYREEKRLSEQAFQFIAKQSPSHYVVQLAQKMREYPKAHWLNADYLMGQYQPSQINDFLAFIRPDNMFINLQAKSIKTNKIEPFFGGQYAVNNLSDQQLNQWRNPKSLPQLFVRNPNPFIAEQLNTIAQPVDNSDRTIPSKVDLDLGVSLWHLQDREFLTPKANLFFTVLLPDKQLSVANKLALNLYSRLLNDKFNKLFYDASSAGINVELYPHSRGLSLKISGYNEKQALVLSKISNLTSASFSEQRFDIIKDNYRRALSNTYKNKPYQQLLSSLSKTLTGDEKNAEKADKLASVTLHDIAEFRKKLFSHAEVRVLSHGNIDEKDAQLFAAKIIEQLQIAKATVIEDKNQIIKLAKNTALALVNKIDNSDSALILYLQGKDKSYPQRAATSLLSEIISTRYSNQLRTEQQLGYLVFASNMSLQKMPGIVFVVQSPHASPEKIQQSNQQFITDFTGHLADISPAKLTKFKQSLITRYQDKERTIYQRSNRFWQELNFGIREFNERESLIEAVSSIQLDDLQLSWQALMARKIQLSSYSNNIAPEQQRQSDPHSESLLKQLHIERVN